MPKNLVHKSDSQNEGVAHVIIRDATNFIKSNGIFMAVIGGVAAIIVLIAIVYFNQQRMGSQRASQMLVLAHTPKQLKEILIQYPSSSSAPIALLAIASQAFSSGSYDQAYTLYAQFREKYPDHSMALAAELGTIMCQEARGAIDQAFAGFSSFAVMHPDHFLVPQAIFGKARCLQTLKRYPDARLVYENFIVANPDSSWIDQAELALNYIDMESRAQNHAKADLSQNLH